MICKSNTYHTGCKGVNVSEVIEAVLPWNQAFDVDVELIPNAKDSFIVLLISENRTSQKIWFELLNVVLWHILFALVNIGSILYYQLILTCWQVQCWVGWEVGWAGTQREWTCPDLQVPSQATCCAVSCPSKCPRSLLIFPSETQNVLLSFTCNVSLHTQHHYVY